MSGGGHFRIKNWGHYQSYKDRKPPWIRLHRSLIDDFTFQSMSAEARALLPMLWLLACEDEEPKSGIIPYTEEEICFRLRLEKKTFLKALKEVQDADFIQCNESVTKAYQDRTPDVPSETETETETETEGGVRKRTTKPPPLHEIWNENRGNLPKAMPSNDFKSRRMKEWATRWKSKPDKDYWVEVIKRLAASDFCNGDNDRGWKATPDFLVKPDTATKALEGTYDNNAKGELNATKHYTHVPIRSARPDEHKTA